MQHHWSDFSVENICNWYSIVTFGADAMVGDTGSNGGFTAVLTERANGVSASTMNFNPATVNAAGSGGVDVTCEDIASVGAVNTTNIAVTYSHDYSLQLYSQPCTDVGVISLFIV